MSVAEFRSLAEMYGTAARPAPQWLFFENVNATEKAARRWYQWEREKCAA